MQNKSEIKQEILRQRAFRIAQKRTTEEDESDFLNLFEFESGGHDYAIPSKHIREVFRFKNVYPVFGAPSWIKGIFNHRGNLYSVFCLSEKVGATLVDPQNGYILLIEDGDQTLALFSSSAGQIKRVREDAVRPDKGVFSDAVKSLFTGIYGEDQRSLLDVQSLLKMVSSLDS